MTAVAASVRGIQWRLSLALGVLAALVLVACLVAWIAFARMQGAVEQITGDSLPRIGLALQIAERSARVTSGAPSIIAAESEDERRVAKAAVDAVLSDLRALVPQWRDGGFGDAGQLAGLTDELAARMDALSLATGRRLEIAARRNAEAGLLLSLHQEFLELLEPRIDDTVFDLATGRADSGAARGLDALMTLKAEGNLVAGLLSEAGNVPDDKLLEPLGERLDAALGQMDRALQKLPQTGANARLRQVTTTLLEFARLGGDIIGLRRAELQQRRLAHAELEASRQGVQRLGAEVDRLVAAAQAQSEDSARGVDRAIASGNWLLALIAAAGLGAALLVMLAYVRPRIVRPIEAITDTMTRLASGDTGIDIPARDREDELGRMAQALEVFRDITVQIQRSNLREIDAARHRLIDAIESISEAFSLFDSEDRLVVFNRCYLTMVHPEIADAVHPGMRFEEIIQAALDRGFVADALGREQEWLAERIHRHRNPGEAHIMQRADQRWIMVSERRTAEGGIVAVYSDITELKERENELAEQTKMLQSLSTQLSRYLSPQVYQSIFTGEQSASVASRRRKLTVYFSDIAGFTESADRMESEDLTELLNEYLTEMSHIALAHGATIDKYIGDAIMIFFGDPVSRGVKEDAVACVLMAIEMRKRLKELVAIWESRGLTERLITRTGIHTGYCTVGNFGSQDRMDYTIIGGAVNLASRLESAAEPGTILISHETYSLVHDVVHCRKREAMRLKGMAYPVETYVAIDAHENLNTETGHVFEQHEHLVLDANLDAMSEAERADAARVLRRILRRLDRQSADADGEDRPEG